MGAIADHLAPLSNTRQTKKDVLSLEMARVKEEEKARKLEATKEEVDRATLRAVEAEKESEVLHHEARDLEMSRDVAMKELS
jgi:hypothetical protein